MPRVSAAVWFSKTSPYHPRNQSHILNKQAKRHAEGSADRVTGIHLKLKRMRFKHDGSFYSAYSLAQALGIDPHAVTRWIKSGDLKANFRGTARGPQQNGDSYLIQEKDVRRFILEHPTEIDLRKVDQLWFLDVLTNGFVCAA